MTSGAQQTRTVPIATLLALGIIGILGPFGTDVYLPALPQMASDLGTTETQIRLTLSLYTIGIATGQLIFGALSDRFGRRQLMIAGSLVVAVAAFTASGAENLSVLLVTCLVLGLGSATGLVTGRAVIADKTTGREAMRYFSLLQMVVSVGPILGPLAGAALLAVSDWRMIFTSLSAFAVVGSLGAMMFVPESLRPENRQSAHPISILKTMGTVLAQRQYLLFALTLWLSFGMLFAYISTSSFIFQTTLDQPSYIYAISFASNGAGIVATSMISARLAYRFSAERILFSGIALQLVGLLLLAVMMLLGVVTVWSVAICLFVIAASMGFVLGSATSVAVEKVRFASGTALAMLGSFQFVSAGISSSLTSIVSHDPLVSFVIVGGFFLLFAALVASLGHRYMRATRV